MAIPCLAGHENCQENHKDLYRLLRITATVRMSASQVGVESLHRTESPTTVELSRTSSSMTSSSKHEVHTAWTYGQWQVEHCAGNATKEKYRCKAYPFFKPEETEACPASPNKRKRVAKLDQNHKIIEIPLENLVNWSLPSFT